MMNKITINYKHQRGAVLAISLILLLVLTVLGISTMDTSGLELKMASNNREHQVAFQAAEAALLAGEDFIATRSSKESDYQSGCTGSSCFTVACTNGQCANVNYVPGDGQGDCTYNVPLIEVWDNANIWTNAATHVAASLGSASFPDPKYIIEFLCYTDAGDGIFDSSSPKVGGAELFRITALGVGQGGKGRVMLQSTYRKIL